jgi:DNA-binding beta-propeller fold protein YncE
MPTLLSYRVQPNPEPLQTGTTGALKIIASNGDRSNRVEVKSLKIVLSVGDNQFDLTTAPGSIVVNIQGDTGWSTEREGGSIRLSKSVPSSVDSLQIVLSSIAINNVVGKTMVRIYEIARLSGETEWSAETRFEGEVWKESQELWIRYFNATPSPIRSGGSTSLTWEASPRATLKLRFDKDGRGVKEVSVSDTGGVFRVDNISRHGRVRFDLIASLGGQSIQAETTVDVQRPLPKIVEFSGDRRGNKINVSWRTEFASRCTITGHSQFFAPSARDVAIDAAIAFVRLTAYNTDDETVSRDLFDYKQNGDVRTAKPLPPDWPPQLGCSLDGSRMYFNQPADASASAGQLFHVGSAADFPNASARPAALWLSVNADGSRYATVDANGTKIFNASNQELMNFPRGRIMPMRIDYAPDDWALLNSGRDTYPYANILSILRYDAITGNYLGHWDAGTIRYLSRAQMIYIDDGDAAIRCGRWGERLGRVAFGVRFAALVADHRETAYAALPDTNEVAVFDGRNADAGVQRRIKVGQRPTGLAVTAREILVANSGDSFLSVIDIDTQTVVDTLPTPEPMCAVAFSPKLGAIFTYAAARNRVVRFVATVRPPQTAKVEPPRLARDGQPPLTCRIAHAPNPLQAGQPATLVVILDNEGEGEIAYNSVRVSGLASFDAIAGQESVFTIPFTAPAEPGRAGVDVTIDDETHSFTVDIFPTGFAIDYLAAVPEEVPANGCATVIWRASGPESDAARFTLTAAGESEINVDAEGLHRIDANQAKTTVVLRATLDLPGASEPIVVERTLVIRAKE